MSSKPGPGDGAEPLGVRRPVELPEADIDAAEGMAPVSAAGQERESERPAAGSRATEPDTAQEAGGTAGRAATAPAAKGRDIAVTAAPAAPAAAAGDGMPPDRPKKPVLAAVAIGGAVVLAVPLLLIGTGTHHGKRHRTVAAADTVLPGDVQPPGAFVSTSPTAVPSPSPSATPSPKKTTPKPKSAGAKHAKPRAAAPAFRGASDVFVKNAASGLCADLPNYGPGTIDGPVNQYHCRRGDGDNQVWTVDVVPGLKGPGGAPLFVIRNTMDDHCMDLPMYGGQPAGTKVTEYYCRPTKSDNQLWYRTRASGSRYRLHDYASHGLCLGATSRSHAADARLEIHSCGSGDDWSFPDGT